MARHATINSLIAKDVLAHVVPTLCVEDGKDAHCKRGVDGNQTKQNNKQMVGNHCGDLLNNN